MKQVLGGILLAVGILIAGASGLCSLVFLFGSGGGVGGVMEMLPAVLMFGGIPFAIGAAVGLGGFVLIRSARNEPERGEE